MLTIYLKDGNTLHSPHTKATLSMIDSIAISGDELWKVASAPFTPLPFSHRTLEDMTKLGTPQQISSPSSIQLILDILRGGERPSKDREDATLDQALERSRVAMTALKQTRDALLQMQPSAAQKRLLEACQKLSAKGYSTDRILGILDADGRPELDKILPEEAYTP